MSIHGMWAKPIIDIDIVAKDNHLFEILKKVGKNNRAGYVESKENEYKDFFENIISEK